MNTAIITGIDGTGKSTLVNQLHKHYEPNSSVRIFSCPLYHTLPGSGAEELSVIFARINSLGNELKQNDIKAIGLYLQMSLYGSVLRKHSSQSNVSFVLSERHAIIDTLVYGSLYAKSVNGIIEKQLWQPVLEKELDKLFPRAFEKVEGWITHLNELTNEKYTFWNYTGFLKKLFLLPPEVIIQNLSRYFNLALPDQICFLKIDPYLAVERLKQRSKQLELHENTVLLNTLQGKYMSAFELIRNIAPDTVIDVFENSDYQQIKNHLPFQ